MVNIQEKKYNKYLVQQEILLLGGMKKGTTEVEAINIITYTCSCFHGSIALDLPIVLSCKKAPILFFLTDIFLWEYSL